MRMFYILPVMISIIIITFIDPILSYPIDGYDTSGIRRLKRLQLILEGKMKGTLPPPGTSR
jgi:hypothetical protein